MEQKERANNVCICGIAEKEQESENLINLVITTMNRNKDHYSTLPGITWYTDESKTEQGTGAGIYSGMRKIELSLPLVRYTSVFQAEVYALLQWARENNFRAYRNKRINILTDSQAALKGLRNHKVTSRLLWECWKELSDLARHNSYIYNT
ncbi:hypothetical protein NQ315_003219 [Exocentrus adspersus]|uniref:RNase H type-1 domain-containing protein n=1 Tax=Exocentrus adspersus TaxID=1586481 RepID=A0AAV8VNE5_9CUCU|nr:hypothetical protein NQ315_003219 [Exocentrus adspersus]